MSSPRKDTKRVWAVWLFSSRPTRNEKRRGGGGAGAVEGGFPLQVDNQDVQRRPFRIGVFAEALVSADVILVSVGDELPLIGKGLGFVQVVEEVFGKVAEAV